MISQTDKTKSIEYFKDFKDGYSKGTIKPFEFGISVFGKNYPQRLKIFQLIKQHPQLYQHYHLLQSSRSSQREHSASLMFSTQRLLNISYQQYLLDPNKVSLISSAFVTYDYGYSIKSGVHFFLYTRAVINLGTERHKEFIQKAVNYEDIGCFALTELMHGSNVKGIETQAHYDHTTKEYIIHSKSKSAMKFWIGASANVANIAVVWANLFIAQKNYGIHAFLVPLRCKKTHKLLPGVIIGDCGPKTGLNVVDNGFIMFEYCRIPSINQLNKISGVDQNGIFYSQIQNQQKRFGLHLAALSGGRFMISMNSGIICLNALTIAGRYLFVRRQFGKEEGNNNNNNNNHNNNNNNNNNNNTFTSFASQSLLINYPGIKHRYLPLLASVIVYNCGNFSILSKWDSNFQNILNPKHLIIQQLHFISSSLKPKTTWLSNQCVRQCRQLMGGYGYSTYSKIGVLINDNEINSTWEGDNNVLLQQTVKIILENMQRTMKGKDIQINILKFLNNPPNWPQIQFTQSNILNLEWCILYFQLKIYTRVQSTLMKMLQLKSLNTNLFDIWNSSQVFLGRTIALTIGDLYYLQVMLIKIKQSQSQQNKKVLTEITLLWLLKEFKKDDEIDGKYDDMIQRNIIKLCENLSHNVLKLLQCLSADDKVIGSPWADVKGKGFEKYLNIIEQVNKDKGNNDGNKPKWYQEFLKQRNQ